MQQSNRRRAVPSDKVQNEDRVGPVKCAAPPANRDAGGRLLDDPDPLRRAHHLDRVPGPVCVQQHVHPSAVPPLLCLHVL